ncbi:hypothetical protein CFN78_20310 [Amycolatopsis antarctica]|uniref:Putative restriction endonuclease domain-containing protein n=1 Tax=Amycolatopsis antarctica TaxID=1854586 RepID=A0A263D1W0_9PSEU|nr:Uma2 family endonuclease [Amycolatopsis antarctica]OZM71486.1 hypothetical protein CFN78_20310 [Amycolatopsis antarctica]
MTVSYWNGRVLSLAEWFLLPEDNSRHFELVNGVVVATAKPGWDHQRALVRLCAQLDRELPSELEGVPSVEVMIRDRAHATVRAPDVVVVPTSLLNNDPSHIHARDVVLAVEVLSPGTARTDRVTKFAEYAEAGIPNYWIIDTESPLSMSAYRLVDGEYELDAEDSAAMTLTTPAPLTIDLPALLASRRR